MSVLLLLLYPVLEPRNHRVRFLWTNQPVSSLPLPRYPVLGSFCFLGFFGSKAGGGCSSQILQTAADSLAGIGVHTLSWFINESTADLPLSQCQRENCLQRLPAPHIHLRWAKTPAGGDRLGTNDATWCVLGDKTCMFRIETFFWSPHPHSLHQDFFTRFTARDHSIVRK